MKVCILAAGIGSRSFSKNIHKALLPLGNQAILSHIINQFPIDSEFVIALGYQAQEIKDFIAIAHPSIRVNFVLVDSYEGIGAGPGYSLLSCKAFLQAPFMFTACDTLIINHLPATKENWIGVSPVTEINKWCSVIVENGTVKNILYKKLTDLTNLAFVGIAQVKNYQDFWLGLEKTESDGEIQVNAGLENLIRHGLNAAQVSWQDTGDAKSYYHLLQQYRKNHTFIGKTTEITYQYDQTIIKFFADYHGAYARFSRAKKYENIFSKVLKHHGRFLSYAFQKGQLLSDTLDKFECVHFLDWAEKNLWKNLQIPTNIFQSSIRKFYFDKTKERVENFYSQSCFDPEMRQEITINGIACKSVNELICEAIPLLEQAAIPSTFHGDLHTDNILKIDQGYVLIDWRDSFGDLVNVGDRYYDLGKFYHTLDLSVEVMDKAKFFFIKQNDQIQIWHHVEDRLKLAQNAFWNFVLLNGYNRKIIELINGIVFLNMAPLYEAKLGEYLYYLGRYSVQRALI